jgi:DNA-binding MarR family transcriptional regulator
MTQTPLSQPRRTRAGDWLGFLLSNASERLRSDTARALAPFNISPKELGALETICADGPISQTDLSKLIRVDRTTMVHIVDRLESAGWIARAQKPGDRRSHALTVTEDGLNRLNHARSVARSVEAAFIASLPPEDVAQLKSALQRLIGDFAQP